MTDITVSCPSCAAKLKLPDFSLVGRRAKCPRCSERFLIQPDPPAPTDIEEELPTLPAAPVQGRAARWVPDDAPAITPPAAPVTAAAAEEVAASGPFAGFPE
ncbi:MAG: hypothetical protein ACPGXX_06630, partial [Planctomycetaceae bacterium]